MENISQLYDMYCKKKLFQIQFLKKIIKTYKNALFLVFLLDRGVYFELEPQNCCITPYSGPIEPKNGLQAKSLMMTYSRTRLTQI